MLELGGASKTTLPGLNGKQRHQHDTLWWGYQVLDPNHNAQHLALLLPPVLSRQSIAASPLNIPACIKSLLVRGLARWHFDH